MGLLDNDTVIVDAILTKLGRQKLANGEPLGISQYAFGDTGVDYTLYNADHPSGSSAYGSAITSLPMLEAVPDDNVFLRFRLYGEGERNVQNFSFITATSGTSVTISKIAGETESTPVTVVPNVFPNVQGATFDYKILDMRGLTAIRGNGNAISANQITLSGGFDIDNLPPFSHPEPVIANITGQGNLTINAVSQQITSQRSVGVEISRDGAASAFVTLTVEVNNTTA